MPGITNPTEVYFKDGIWGWATNTWEKLISKGGRLFTALHGWDGSAWHKLPLIFGYSGQYAELETAINVPAGAVTMTFSTVPAGEFWHIAHFETYSLQANATYCVLRAIIGGATLVLKYSANPGAYVSFGVSPSIILKEDDYLLVVWAGASLNDDFYASAFGYKMKIAE